MKLIRLPCLAAILAQMAYSYPGTNHFAPLERSFTLREKTPFSLEGEYSRLIAEGGHSTYTFPRSCYSAIDSSQICNEKPRLEVSEGAGEKAASISILGGYETRSNLGRVQVPELGLKLSGHVQKLSFYLDARMFVELHEDSGTFSYDREFVEKQKVSESKTIAYSSYSRYRSNVSYDLGWAKIGILRDAVHWGPAIFTNLTFNKDCVPFNHVTLSTDLGNFSILSMYGQLSLNENGDFRNSKNDRSLYAHRYVWRPFKGITLGISETLILYNKEAPFAFVPIVPLFIAKGFETESANNGSISFDASYNIQGIGSLYGEFLVDDIISPTSLFDSHWGNKWGVMGGFHHSRNFGPSRYGAIFELSRIEPWVYTHYLPRTAQTANHGYPMGNQLGPNSLWFVAKTYLRLHNGLYFAARLDMQWKGADRGSSLLDGLPQETKKPKQFLADVGLPNTSGSPTFAWIRGPFSIEISSRIGNSVDWLARAAIYY